MPPEFREAQPGFQLETALADKALDALFAGDNSKHDMIAAEVAAAQLPDCDVIALAQFKPVGHMARRRSGRASQP